jgi:hypothetical protein
MQKISSQDAATLLKQAGAAIRALKAENSGLREKVASGEREKRVEKIAREMEEKGLSSDLSFEQKIAAVRKAPNLEVTEEAIKLAAPQGNFFGQINDEDGPSGVGLSAFEQYIITGEEIG